MQLFRCGLGRIFFDVRFIHEVAHLDPIGTRHANRRGPSVIDSRRARACPPPLCAVPDRRRLQENRSCIGGVSPLGRCDAPSRARVVLRPRPGTPPPWTARPGLFFRVRVDRSREGPAKTVYPFTVLNQRCVSGAPQQTSGARRRCSTSQRWSRTRGRGRHRDGNSRRPFP